MNAEHRVKTGCESIVRQSAPRLHRRLLPKALQGLGGATALLLLPASVHSLEFSAGEAERQLFELAARQGVELTLLDRPARFERGEAGDALEPILDKNFNRVEVYDETGDLERIVALSRDGQAKRFVPPLETQPSRASRVVETPGSRAAEERMPLAQAIAIAKDPNASLDERLEAIAALSGRDSSAAVDALAQVAREGSSTLQTQAISALASFAGRESAGAAEAAVRNLAEEGVGDRTDVLRSLAAYDMSPLIQEFRSAENTLIMRELLYAAAAAAPDSGTLTAFLVEALDHPYVTIRSDAARAAVIAVDRVELAPVVGALEEMFANDDWDRGKRAAARALEAIHRDPNAQVGVADPLPDGTSRVTTPQGDDDLLVFE